MGGRFEDVRLPMPEAEFVGRAIAGDGHGLKAMDGGWPARPWPRTRVPAFDRDPTMVRCDRHGEGAVAIPEDPPMVIRYSAVPMHRQTWRDARHAVDIWLGQCPDCGTIYYAIGKSG